MKKSLTLLLLVFVCAIAVSDTTKEMAGSYIARYSSIAVEEMHRSGIPASITLAQGLLESGYGRSRLATEANNHFGIKCHKDWKGESVREDDDRKGECFRKYPSAEDSYRDHSDFLRFKSRYAPLFQFDIRDYKSWAAGLKSAGYATDPAYPSKLIKIIEDYNLSRFDVISDSLQADTPALPPTPEELAAPERVRDAKKAGKYTVSLEREVMKLNGTPFIYARSGETYRSISLSYGLFPKELAFFNDSTSPEKVLNAGEIVFLQRKASKAVRGLDKHIASEGETLWSISQKYAVRLKSLMKYNDIPEPGRVFSEDETVLLRPAARGKQ